MRLIVSAGVALAAVLVASVLARLAGEVPRATLTGTPGRRAADALRVFAALSALALVVGGSNGDIVVAGALAAAALGRRFPAGGLAVIFVAAVPALRAGSSAIEDVAGVHAVLGPAVLSPSIEVAAAAVLAGAAALATASVLVPSPPRGGSLAILRLPGASADAVALTVVVLLGVVAAAGPPLAEGVSGSWPAARFAAVAFGLAAAALVRRLAGGVPEGVRAGLGAAAAAGAVLLAVATP